jgi:hypothetical protein
VVALDAPPHALGGLVLPTLNGRLQTRIFLVAVVGTVWTIIVTPFVALFVEGDPELGDVYKVTFTILALVLVLGIVWEFIYHGLMQFRWEKDWPTLFGYATVINEAIVVWLVADALAIDDGIGAEWRLLLSGLTVTPFLVHIVSTWIVLQLFASNLLRPLFPRWRYRGGRILGGW